MNEREQLQEDLAYLDNFCKDLEAIAQVVGLPGDEKSLCVQNYMMRAKSVIETLNDTVNMYKINDAQRRNMGTVHFDSTWRKALNELNETREKQGLPPI